MKKFNPTSERPARAVQAWQILVGRAMNRQTVTYENLSELMYGRQAAGVLAGILGHIAFCCKDNNLPILTALVVGKGQGKPGDRIPLDPARIDDEREGVYQRDWFDIYPPSEADFTTAEPRLRRFRRSAVNHQLETTSYANRWTGSTASRRVSTA